MAPAVPGRPSKPSPSLRCRRPAANALGPVPSRRNERERQRVRQVNLGFQALRQHVPPRGGAGAPRRLSKVQTLQAALSYIRGLQELLLRGAEGSPGSGLEEEEDDGESSPGTEEEREAEEAAWLYGH